MSNDYKEGNGGEWIILNGERGKINDYKEVMGDNKWFKRGKGPGK